LSRKMRLGARCVCAVALAIAAAPWAERAGAQDLETETTWWRETFDRSPLGFVDPSGHDPRLLARVYSVARDGDNSVLRATHDDTGGDVPAMHFGKAFTSAPPPLDRVRSLRWRWRVLRHPDVEGDPWADLAASVYVVVRAPALVHGGRGFKLGWLAKSGPGDTYQHGLLQIPLEAGGALGEWRSESVDLCAMYRRVYGNCEGEHVLYVGVVTDADATHSIAAAEYDDFELVTTR
jgi:Protein of unknown function (DUF3047)